MLLAVGVIPKERLVGAIDRRLHEGVLQSVTHVGARGDPNHQLMVVGMVMLLLGISIHEELGFLLSPLGVVAIKVALRFLMRAGSYIGII